MTAQALEQIADEFIGTQSIKTYETIDVYASGVDALFTPPPMAPDFIPVGDYGANPTLDVNAGFAFASSFNPIGSQGSGFQTGGQNNIYSNFDCDNSWQLQERLALYP